MYIVISCIIVYVLYILVAIVVQDGAIRCGWMRTKIYPYTWIVMRSRIRLFRVSYRMTFFSLSFIDQQHQFVCNSLSSILSPYTPTFAKSRKWLKFRLSQSLTYKWPQNAFRAFWRFSKPWRGYPCDWLTPDSISDRCFFKLSEHWARPCAMF